MFVMMLLKASLIFFCKNLKYDVNSKFAGEKGKALLG